jgi:hypothetical protein
VRRVYGRGRLEPCLQDVLSGYGYAPGRGALWLAVMFTVGWSYLARHRSLVAEGDHLLFNARAVHSRPPAASAQPRPGRYLQPVAHRACVRRRLRLFGWVLTIALLASLTAPSAVAERRTVIEALDRRACGEEKRITVDRRSEGQQGYGRPVAVSAHSRWRGDLAFCRRALIWCSVTGRETGG